MPRCSIVLFCILLYCIVLFLCFARVRESGFRRLDGGEWGSAGRMPEHESSSDPRGGALAEEPVIRCKHHEARRYLDREEDTSLSCSFSQ